MDDMKEVELTVSNEQIDVPRAVKVVDDIVARTRKALPASRVALIPAMLGLAFFSAACLEIAPSENKSPTQVVAEAPKQPTGPQITERKPAPPTSSRTPETIQRPPGLTPYEQEVLNKLTPEEQKIWWKSKQEGLAEAAKAKTDQDALLKAQQEAEKKAKEEEGQFIKDLNDRQIAVHSLDDIPKVTIEVVKTVGGTVGVILAGIGGLVLSVIVFLGIPLVMLGKLTKWFSSRDGSKSGQGGRGIPPRYGGP